MIKIENKQVFSNEGKKLRRKASPSVIFSRATILPGDIVEDFEEVDADTIIFDESEYKSKVEEYIAERYDKADEIALINNFISEPNEEHRNEYQQYQEWREQCKLRARQSTLENH